MSETPVERQTVIDKPRGEQVGSEEADSRGSGSRSLQAGSAFLKALAADLGAVVSRVRRLLAAGRRQPSPALPPSGVSLRSGGGSAFWRVCKVLLGSLLVCSGVLSTIMLWVIFGPPFEPRTSDMNIPGLRAEAANHPSPSRDNAVDAAKPSRSDAGTIAATPIQPRSSSASAAAQQTTADAQAGSNRPQPLQTETLEQTETPDRGLGAGRLTLPAMVTKRRPGECSVDSCATTYKSFNSADCTYQPYGGGPRAICELGNAPAPWHRWRAATSSRGPGPDGDAMPVARMAQEIAEPQAQDRAGPQCDRSRCAAMYQSFQAADCTYQPEGGGPRRVCEP
jgi:BA14K-like protein